MKNETTILGRIYVAEMIIIIYDDDNNDDGGMVIMDEKQHNGSFDKIKSFPIYVFYRELLLVVNSNDNMIPVFFHHGNCCSEIENYCLFWIMLIIIIGTLSKCHIRKVWFFLFLGLELSFIDFVSGFFCKFSINYGVDGRFFAMIS